MMRLRGTHPQAACWLYELLDGADEVLYVGITCMPAERMRAHRGSKPWWPEVRTQRWHRFEHRAGAEQQEALLIEALRPPYNAARNLRLAFQDHWPPNALEVYEVAV